MSQKLLASACGQPPNPRPSDMAERNANAECPHNERD